MTRPVPGRSGIRGGRRPHRLVSPQHDLASASAELERNVNRLVPASARTAAMDEYHDEAANVAYPHPTRHAGVGATQLGWNFPREVPSARLLQLPGPTDVRGDIPRQRRVCPGRSTGTAGSAARVPVRVLL